jgi:hypothetical protein
VTGAVAVVVLVSVLGGTAVWGIQQRALALHRARVEHPELCTTSDALYGLRWPRWYVRARGLHWLRHGGWCPSCYSSPPLPCCPICHGSYLYGPNLPETLRSQWRTAWLERTHP